MEDLTLRQASEIIVQELAGHGIVIGYPVLNDDGFITEQARAALQDFAPVIFGLAHKLAQEGHRSPRETKKLASRMKAAQSDSQRAGMVRVFDGSLKDKQSATSDSPQHWVSRNKLALKRRPTDHYNQFTRDWRKTPIARGWKRYAKGRV